MPKKVTNFNNKMNNIHDVNVFMGFFGGAGKALVSGVQLLLYRLEKSQYFTIIFFKAILYLYFYGHLEKPCLKK